MGRMLTWMSKPDTAIPDNSWAGFLDYMAAASILLIVVAVVVTILCYTASAKRRKIFAVDHLFAPYTPMNWILMAIPAAFVAGSICLWQYDAALETTEGRWGIALQLTILTGALSALLSYLLIILIPSFTPAKFRYRPAPFLAKKAMAAKTGGRN